MIKKLISFTILLLLFNSGYGQEKDTINNMRETLLRNSRLFSSIINNDTSSLKYSGTGAVESSKNDISTSQHERDKRYKRISIYSLVTSSKTKPYNTSFINGFGNSSVNLPEKYNSHDVGEYIIPLNQNSSIAAQIEDYLNKNNVAKQLITKWFRRGRNGQFDMALVADRGEYDASFLEQSIAKKTVRGAAMLQDAGEELIGKTFVCVYDFNFIDKGKKYAIEIDCYLYRLLWDEASASKFYNNYWIDKNSSDIKKKQAFNSSSDFKMQYVGVVKMDDIAFDKPLEQTVVNGNTKYSIDESSISGNITYLQFGDFFKKIYSELERAFEEFRTKFTLYSTDPIAAKIGTKEDVKAGDKFEVLEKTMNKDGTFQYKQIAIISVTDNNKVWDNNTKGDWLGTNKNKLQYTVFEGDKNKLATGMLIRKIYTK